VHDLRTRADYAGLGPMLPGLLRALHAVTCGPRRDERERALRRLVHTAYDAAGAAKELGYPADAWLVRSSAMVGETARALLDRARRDAGGTRLRGFCERVGVAI
jgi:hypothetical protein